MGQFPNAAAEGGGGILLRGEMLSTPISNHSCRARLTFLLKERNQEEHRFWCVVSSIGKPVRIRHGPATVIVEGWPECH